MGSEEATVQAIEALVQLAVNVWTLGAAIVVYLAVRFANRAIDAADSPRLTAVWRRLLPLIPELIAVLGVLVGGVQPVSGKPLAIQLAVALWIAYLSTKAQKFLGQTVLGDDAKIEAMVTRSKPSAPAKEE